MPRSRSRPRVGTAPEWQIQSGFNLGGEQAETDRLLEDAFVESGPYRVIESRDDPRCFLVGRTGSGKTAVLKRLELSHAAHVIRISPDDLSLQYITDLGVIQYLSELEVSLDPFFIALWKHVLVIEIIKHRYDVGSPDAVQRFLRSLMDKVRRDRSKRAALEYLQEFEGKFWRETDERIREITQEFESRIEAEAAAKLGASLASLSSRTGAQTNQSLSERAELVGRFKRIVNDSQLPRLNHMLTVLSEDILDAQHHTYVVIDDLDRDWADEKITNDLIRCLFRAVMDLKRVQNLKVLVALRTNIVETLDFGRLGGQQEKYRSLTMKVRWSATDLRAMLDQRARMAAARHGATHVKGIADLLPPETANGDPLNQILAKTLLRPRDAIAFLNECFEHAVGLPRLRWDVIRSAETSYSNNRLLALRDEWKPTYPGIDRVFELFHESPKRLTRTELARILSGCVPLAAQRNFPGRGWLGPLVRRRRTSDGDLDTMYQPVVRILYGIGFLGYSLGKHNPDVYSHEEPDDMDRPNTFRQAAQFVIHPAFRLALDLL